MKPFFITGTDTDCGKTYVTCQLLQYCRSQNIKAEAIKPVASGCIERAGHLYSPDALAISEYSGLSPDEINPWRFSTPVSPHIAADMENQRIDIEALVRFCEDSRWQSQDVLLVEGAGGIAVPLNEEENWLHFLKASSMPVILVVGMKLGCINHALLSEAILYQQGIICAGWIANYSNESAHLQASDAALETLKKQMRQPLLATVPFEGKIIPYASEYIDCLC